MAPFDNPEPLPDLAGDSPTGENLEFDPDFAELERLSQGKPEQQYGTTVVPAEEPDWKAVIAAAEALTERSYDLRILSRLAVARLQRLGVAGYTATMGAIRELLERHWDTVHPQLDPEDDNDPMLRANALLQLSEIGRVLRVLRTMPLARSTRAGDVSWRDIAIAAGTLEVDPDTARMTDGEVAAAFRETDPAQLAALRATLAEAAAHAAAIPAVFNDRAGYGTGPDYTDLDALLREMLGMIDTHAHSGPEPEAPGEVSGPAGAVPGAAQGGGPGTATGDAPAVRSAPVMSIATMGPPTTRRDAVRLLELVVQYYERNEPASPLPLLIGRALRLADKNFMEILQDLAPDGVNQAETVTGRVG